jgi:hypothetical protein
MPRSPTVRLTARLERIKNLADDLTRELVRAQGGGLAAHAVAVAIRREIDVVLRTPKNELSRWAASVSHRRR